LAKIYKGIGVSDGYVIGEAYIDKNSEVEVLKINISGDHSAEEVARFLDAVDKAKEEQSTLLAGLKEKGRDKEAGLLEIQMRFLNDQDLLDEISDKIESSLCNSEYAIDRIFAEKIAVYENIDNDYMQDLAADLRRVGRNLLNILAGRRDFGHDGGKAKIMVTEELLPAMVLNAMEYNIRGFVTEKGGEATHAAILARAFDIPVIMGIEGARSRIREGETLVLDSGTGSLVTRMDMSEAESYAELYLEREGMKQELLKMRDVPAETADGVPYELAANIVSTFEVDKALENRAMGIGLMRTEFLYMKSRQLPDEETQFAAYREVAEKMKGRPVNIRALDSGSDKVIPGITFFPEDNPAMGWRGVRILLEKTDIFRTQLRAILRASAFGTVRLVLPMVISPEEIRQVRLLMEEVRQELRGESIPFDEQLEVGMMVETPASVFILDILLKELDFVTIGTNDLTQYILAADRTNNRLSGYYNHSHPAVLRAVRQVCRVAGQAGVRVGVCGEMASDIRLAPVLVGMGVNQLSVSPGRISLIKNEIRKHTMEQLRELAENF